MFHRRGEIFSHSEFLNPTPEVFCLWLDDFIRENPEFNYDLYLVGAFCDNLFGNGEYDTKDVDIVFTGHIKNRSLLKKYLDSAFEIGIRHGILIDVAWRNQILTFLSNPGDYHEKIVNYLDVEHVDENGRKSVYTLDGTITQLMSGLYYVTDFDTTRALEKTKERSYSVPYKKIKI
jgi:hypothetical protein